MARTNSVDLSRTGPVTTRKCLAGPAVTHTRDKTEIRAVEIGARVSPLGSVHDAESLRPKLQFPTLGDVEIAEQ